MNNFSSIKRTKWVCGRNGVSYRNICSMKRCGKVRRKKWGKCGQPSNKNPSKKTKKKKKKPKSSYNKRTTTKKPPSYVKLPECEEKCKKYQIK